jgi:hypothetical protein
MGPEAEDTPIPMASGRALAKHIVAEFQPIIESLIHSAVANAIVEVTTRLSRVEEWQRVHDARVTSGDTGSHSVEELTRKMQESESRLKRKIDREKMAIEAARAVEKANHAWWRQNSGKAALITIAAIWQGILLYLGLKK